LEVNLAFRSDSFLDIVSEAQPVFDCDINDKRDAENSEYVA